MRRLLIGTLAAAAAAGLAAPAMAKVPVPVGAGSDGKGGECVYAFDWVPQCVNPGSVGAPSSGAGAHAGRMTVPQCPPQPLVQVQNGTVYIHSGCITVAVPIPPITTPPQR